MYHNLGWKWVKSIIYQSTFLGSDPLDGDGLSGFDFWYKIQNLSSSPQYINVPLTGHAMIPEFDPTNADLTINRPVYLSGGNLFYAVYGRNSHVLYLNNSLEGSSSVSMTIYEYSKVAIGYNNGSGSFGGGVYIKKGELWFREGAAINGGVITVGSPDTIAKVYIEDGNGGTTVPNNIQVIASSISTVGGLNSSGTNTYSGTVALAANATLETWSGGTVDFTGDISGSYGVTVSRVSGSSDATVRYTTSAKSYTGLTTVSNGAVLVLSVANALPTTNAVTITSGGTLHVSANTTLGDLTLNAGGTLIVDAGVTLTLGGTWTGGGTLTNNGTIVLTGPSAFPGSSTTVSAMNNLTINRSGGVTLDKALSVSGVLTLTSGVLSTTSANLLSITSTATGAVAGGSTSSYVSGPLLRTLPSSLGTGSTYVFPTGKSTYLPLTVKDATTGTGTITLTAEAFSSNAGGTPTVPLSALSNSEYWSLASTGNLTNHKVSLTRQSAVAPLNRIGRSTTLTGTYSSVGGSPSGNSILNSNTTGAGVQQYFVMAQGGAGAVTLQPDIKGLCIGDTVHVPLTITADSLGGLNLVIEFDHSVLLFVGTPGTDPGYDYVFPGYSAMVNYNFTATEEYIDLLKIVSTTYQNFSNNIALDLIFIYNGGSTTIGFQEASCSLWINNLGSTEILPVAYSGNKVEGKSVATPTITGPSTPCRQSTGNVYTTETGKNAYLWSVSSGGTVTAGGGTGNNTVTVTWNTAGAQTVNVKHVVGADTSCLRTHNVTVAPTNTVSLTSGAGTNNQTLQVNTPITAITYGTTGATVTGLPAGVTGSWAGNVVTISGTPTVSGVFNYTVTLTGGCGVITATGVIRVSPFLEGNPASLTFGPTCLGTTPTDMFVLTGAGLDGSSVTVTCPSNFECSTAIGGPYASSLTLTSPGANFTQNIYVKFKPTAVQSYSGNIVLSGGGASSANVAVSGSGIDSPVITSLVAFPNDTICEGANLLLQCDSSGIITGFNWNGPPGEYFSNIREWPVGQISSGNSGTYTVYAFNGCGSSDTLSLEVLINPVDSLYLNVTPSDTVCVGETVTFTATAGFDEYFWYAPPGTFTGPLPNHTSNTWTGQFTAPSGATPFHIQVGVTTVDGCSQSVLTDVWVYPRPSTGPIYHN